MINPTNLQFGMMMVQSVRYAIGKTSHVVPMTCDFIRPLIPELDLSILYIIEKDITRAHKGHNLGMAEDAGEWLQLRADIQKEIANRKNISD